jgi:hypothetical protein
MGLFGKSKPREIKALDESIRTAQVALGLYDTLPAAQQASVLKDAPVDIKAATARAKSVGESQAAKELLVAAKGRTISSSVKSKWPEIIDEALATI